MNKIKLKKVRRWLVPILLTFFVWGIFRWVLLVGYVPTESMAPTIPKGGVIVAARSIHEINRGDILIFTHDGKKLVKRVAAIPGDSIHWEEFRMGHTETNGWDTTVPINRFLVCGDNAEQSLDSRFWDDPYVKQSEIIGRVRFILYFG